MPARILFVHSRKASFIAIDRAFLAERHDVRDWYQPGRVPNVFGLLPAVLRSDLVFAWFASWHSFVPITLAWLFRRPSVLIVGGFDTANMPDIDYGHQRGGFRRWASRFLMKRATRLVTHSNYTLEEIDRNTPIPRERVTVMHLGVPDPFGELPPPERRRVALTVGAIDSTTLDQKGQRPFVQAASHLPDVSFVFVGKWDDDAVDELRRVAADNVTFSGWLSDEELLDRYRQAAAYVQASRHEGFGLAVAEAMLAGCIPVVMDVTAMPEVVGDTGVLLSSQRPEEVAEGVRRALDLPPEARARARERILTEFPLKRRAAALLTVVEEALEGRSGGR